MILCGCIKVSITVNFPSTNNDKKNVYEAGKQTKLLQAYRNKALYVYTVIFDAQM